MSFHPYTSSYQFSHFSVFLLLVVIGGFVRLARRTFRGRRRGVVLEQPNGPTAPGPIKISGLWLRMRLVYANSPRRRPRRVTLYAVKGHRGPDGRITLDLLHTVCNTVRAPRNFRVDRIITATNMQGEPIRNLSAWVLTAAGMH